MPVPTRSALRSDHSIESRLAEVQDRLAIRELTARYNFAIDDRDLGSVADLFTEDACFGSKDGAMRANGRAAVLEQFAHRFADLGATNHFAHDHAIWFEGAMRARGQVSVHAELWRRETPMVSALRYEDRYEKGTDGLWRFAERLLCFFYYLDVRHYASALGTLERNHASDRPVAADYPERLPTYVELRPGRRKPT